MNPPDDLVGVPWERHGRSLDGADCWGLVQLWYARVLGRDLPDYLAEMALIGADAAARQDLMRRETASGWRLREPGAEQVHDVVLLRAGRFHEHVGVWLGAGLMLHSEGPEGLASVIQRIDDPSLRHRVVGFFHPASDS